MEIIFRFNLIIKMLNHNQGFLQRKEILIKKTLAKERSYGKKRRL